MTLMDLARRFETIDADMVRISSMDDITRCALNFRTLVESCFQARVAPCADISKREVMRDSEGSNMATSIFGWPAKGAGTRWQCAGFALTSAIATGCRYGNEPFWVNEQGFHGSHTEHLLNKINLSEFRKGTISRAAIVVPIHLPFGRIAAISFRPYDEDQTDMAAEFASYADILGQLSHIFMSSYVKVTDNGRIKPLAEPLTMREVECLRWASYGKTDDEIAIIIGRSRSTVRSHMQNAIEKLDTVNRSQAVCMATRLGYI